MGLLVLAGLAAGLGSAGAQNNTAPAVQNDAASKGGVLGAGSGSGGGSPNTTVDPTTGVAGTGMGTVKKGNAMGTGSSVKGPAGQGISNSTDAQQ